MAGFFETWVSRLRLAWMGDKAKAIMGGFAAAMADKSLDWADAAVKMRMPTKASDVAAYPLIGSGRLLPQGPDELDADYATRLLYWTDIWKFARTPLGMLLGLHFIGLDGCYIVQQNGLAYSLSLPLPAFGDGWDPTPNLVITNCMSLATALTSNVTAGHSAPAGVPWFKFDDDTDWCSRFCIIFPNGFPSRTEDFATATFTGAEDGTIAHPWPTATWSTPISVLRTMVGVPTITDGGGPVVVAADATSATTTSIRIISSAPFTGTVDVKLFGVDTAGLQLLRDTVSLWRPRKANCMGVFAITRGEMWDWPPTKTWDTQGPTWDRPSSITTLIGSF